MTGYRDLVQRILACRHADLELGLSRAREQEGFVRHVSDLLDKVELEYTVRMDKDFQTTFCIEFSPSAPAKARSILSAYYPLFAEGDTLEVSSVRPEGYCVRIVFGDVPF